MNPPEGSILHTYADPTAVGYLGFYTHPTDGNVGFEKLNMEGFVPLADAPNPPEFDVNFGVTNPEEGQPEEAPEEGQPATPFKRPAAFTPADFASTNLADVNQDHVNAAVAKLGEVDDDEVARLVARARAITATNDVARQRAAIATFLARLAAAALI